MSKEKSKKQEKAQIGIRDKYGWSPIHYAASSGNFEQLKKFVLEGSDVNMLIKSSDEFSDCTAAIFAARRGDIEMLLFLARSGADLNLKDALGMSALMYGTQHQDREITIGIVKVLISMGADTSQFNNLIKQYGHSILRKLGVKSEFTKEISNLLQSPSEVRLAYSLSHDLSPITHNTEENNKEKIKLTKARDLFNNLKLEEISEYVKDSSIPETDKYIINFFVEAASNPTSENIKKMIILVQSKYDISRANSDGKTAYELLKAFNLPNGIALSLLGSNSDVASEINKIGEDGLNDIHRAIKAGKFQTLLVLLTSGGDPNMPTKNGKLPLSLVMESKLNMSEMFYFLIKNGAKIDDYNLDNIQKLAHYDMIDPSSVTLMKAAKDGELKCLKLDEMLKKIEKSFWQKITLLDYDQIDDVIIKFKSSSDIDIDKIVAESSNFKDALSIVSKMNMSSLITEFMSLADVDQDSKIIGGEDDFDAEL
jgi:ankyrin repeat protein